MTENTTYAHSVEARHIVSQNEKLHETNLELRKNLSVVENERDKYEEEVFSREKQVTYLRGLLKNFIAMKKEQETIDNLTISIGKTVLDKKKPVNKYIKTLEIVNILYICLFTLWFFLDKIYTIPNTTIITSTFIVLVLPVNLSLRNYKRNITKTIEKYKSQNTTNTRIISNCKSEIKNIEKACDFLNEYVDVI